MKKLLAIILAALMVLALTSACGNTSDPAPPPAADTPADSSADTPADTAADAPAGDEGPAPIFFEYLSFVDQENDQVGLVMDKYMEENPHVTIEKQTMDHDSFQALFLIMVESDTLPDMFWQTAYNVFFSSEDNPDVVVDLAPHLPQSFIDSILPDAMQSVTGEDGRIVGFPAEMGVQAWMWNKSLFDQVGLSIPTTDAELLEAAKVFAENDLVLIAQGTLDSWPTWGFENWTALHGCWETSVDTYATHTLKFGDSAWGQTLSFIAELADLGAFPQHNSTMNFEQMTALFTSGNAGVINLPSDQLANIIGTPVENDIVFNWGITFPGQEAAQNQVFRSAGNCYAIGSKAASDPAVLEEIIKFNLWRYEEENAVIPLQHGFNLPISFETVDMSTMSKAIAEQAVLIADTSVEAMPTQPLFAIYWAYEEDHPKWTNIWPTQIDVFRNGLIDGTVTTRDLPAFFDSMDKLIDEQKLS